MPAYLLRAEGVNFAAIIDDTDDLSTRRGGGLMLLNAPAQLAATIEPAIRSRLNPVATGASVGLFTFDADDELDAMRVRDAVAKHLRTEKENAHATFVVDAVPIDGDPAGAVERAVAANRWRQLQAPSLALEGLWDEAPGPCEFDFVRPGVATVLLPVGRAAPASRSVADRREYGRDARQTFYDDELGRRPGRVFVDDFETLAKACGIDAAVAPPGTHDKLAVFYVDGNSFGARGRAILNANATADAFTAFSEWSAVVRAHHMGLLGALVDRAEKDPSWQNGGRLRIETLLWGGDEILWVVPAWKGWELANWFFGQAHAVRLNDDPQPLTYGGGLVFCHRKAPIKNVVALAHTLGDAAKAAAGSGRHSLAYEVLESFDDVYGDFDDHRVRWLPRGTPAGALVLDPALGEDFWRALREIAGCDEFPMRQLYRLNRAWRDGKPTDSHLRRITDSPASAAFETFCARVGGDVAWLHLLQMLPYMPSAAPAGEGNPT